MIKRFDCRVYTFSEEHQRVDNRISGFDGDYTFDYGVTVGGDGTVLRFNSQFPVDCKPPPVIPFSLGTLGFLLPFQVDSHEGVIQQAVSGTLPIIKRQRLTCKFVDTCSSASHHHHHDIVVPFAALNEVLIAGNTPNGGGGLGQIARLQCALDGRHLTEAVADGVLIATSTGSTAYSLSAGGPVMHPQCQTVVLTPISPRSLSFRPMVLPDHSKITITTQSSSATSQVVMDGQVVGVVEAGGAGVTVSKATFALDMFAQTCSEWGDRITGLLGWNRSYHEHHH